MIFCSEKCLKEVKKMEMNEEMVNTLKNQKSILNFICNLFSNTFKRENLPKVTKQTKYPYR